MLDQGLSLREISDVLDAMVLSPPRPEGLDASVCPVRLRVLNGPALKGRRRRVRAQLPDLQSGRLCTAQRLAGIQPWSFGCTS